MRIALVSLGCPKNQVDSEIMLGLLKEEGFDLVSNEKDAEIILINTCGFIDKAKEESIDTILEISELKKKGTCRFIVVTGCLTQRYADELIKEIPEIDVALGTGAVGDIVKVCKDLGRKEAHKVYTPPPEVFSYDGLLPRLHITPSHSVYVKIAEGCGHSCTFCIIPQLRGRQRSRSMESIVREVDELARRGAVEINLVAQDTTAYGRDLREPDGLTRLLRELIKIDGVKWIRLLYTYPGALTENLIALMAGEEKICNYIDMPIQHINDRILHQMHRGYTRKDIYRTIETLRSRIPDLVLRTSLMVGFPGEDDRAFNELVEFVEEIEFDRLGVFTYSREEGTVSYDFPGRVRKKEMEKRQRIIMEIQQAISFRKNLDLKGTSHTVLVDGYGEGDPSLPVGRTYGHAPEVDGLVYIRDTEGMSLIPGDMITVEITDAGPYDLTGRILC